MGVAPPGGGGPDWAPRPRRAGRRPAGFGGGGPYWPRQGHLVTWPSVPVPGAGSGAMRARAAAGAHGQVSGAGPGGRGRPGPGAELWPLPAGSAFPARRGARRDRARARARGSARRRWGLASPWDCCCCWRLPLPAAGPRRTAPPGATRGERGQGCRGPPLPACADTPCSPPPRAPGTWRGWRICRPLTRRTRPSVTE